jgi:hypothetical protein
MQATKSFVVGDKVTWLCPISKKRYVDTIVYIGQNSIEGSAYDLSYLYLRGKLERIQTN